MSKSESEKKEIFENRPVASALAIMAVPTIVSQLIILIYNMADTYFLGQTNNPYMVAACALDATVFLMLTAIANLFGVGGGTLTVQLIGRGDEKEAKKVASLSLILSVAAALAFSLICLIFMNPILRVLGASDNTIGYARQYMFFVIVIGALPTVLSNTMSSIIRNIGYSREAAFGLSMGGILNVILDPLFMFVIMPEGYQVMGAALATMISNFAAFAYYSLMYYRLRNSTILCFPKKIEAIRKDSLKVMMSIGVPSAVSLLLFDLCNITINMLSASHGDIQLAAIGIVLKIERLPLNVGIGICLGMMPLVAYNYAAGNQGRMRDFFGAARISGLVFALICVGLYRVFAADVMRIFIADSQTVAYGTQFLRARCFATPFMFLSFHMVHYMQAIRRGGISFWLAVIRQLCLNIPFLYILNSIFGMSGIIWTQASADIINVIISYIIYYKVMKKMKVGESI